jgi:hypothetical protein
MIGTESRQARLPTSQAVCMVRDMHMKVLGHGRRCSSAPACGVLTRRGVGMLEGGSQSLGLAGSQQGHSRGRRRGAATGAARQWAGLVAGTWWAHRTSARSAATTACPAITTIALHAWDTVIGTNPSACRCGGHPADAACMHRDAVLVTHACTGHYCMPSHPSTSPPRLSIWLTRSLWMGQ